MVKDGLARALTRFELPLSLLDERLCCRWVGGRTDDRRRDTGMTEEGLVPTGLPAQPRLVRR